ncbi:hypothetical protein AOLI_G00062880 [Acnodon oligacanthus]
MTLDDRKKFLKENNIFFRYCASTAHQAKSCEIPIKCKECDSDKHLAALHPGPAPQPQSGLSPSSENGGEREDTGQLDVTSRCTKVSAIVNARPLIPVYTDPEAPLILTPSMLLTQKIGAPLSPAIEFVKGDLLKNHWKSSSFGRNLLG